MATVESVGPLVHGASSSLTGRPESHRKPVPWNNELGLRWSIIFSEAILVHVHNVIIHSCFNWGPGI